MQTVGTLVSNIVWDTDGDEEAQARLPKSVLLVGRLEDEALDALSDHYDWLVESSEMKIIQGNKGDHCLIGCDDVIFP